MNFADMIRAPIDAVGRGLTRAKEYVMDEPIDFAMQESMRAYPGESGSTRQDAMRHMLWMGELSRRIGKPAAGMVGLLNEASGTLKGQPLSDLAMDLRNNELGAQLSALPPAAMLDQAKRLTAGAVRPREGFWGGLNRMLQPNFDPTYLRER